jgi:hypothetical protein
MDNILLMEVTDTIWIRLAVCAVSVIIGAGLIWVGRENIRTEEADEHGRGRLVNSLLGFSNSYEGGTAVVLGWIRVIMGVVCIIFGVTFIYVGPFLAN